MYAVIEDSGTQIKVAQGDVIKVAKRQLPDDAVSLTFDRVLMVSDGDGGGLQIGQPLVEKATVTGDREAYPQAVSGRLPGLHRLRIALQLSQA